tara:strand:+ start:2044 stop:2361 length:318 start_codon:yes stop_codon:yes gene_type:complete
METLVKDRQLKPQFILMALEKELREHDWTFNYSDDHGVWTSGVSHQKRIKAMVEDAYAEDIDPADLFYQYYPMEGCDIPGYYGIKRSWEDQLDKKAKELTKEDDA